MDQNHNQLSVGMQHRNPLNNLIHVLGVSLREECRKEEKPLLNHLKEMVVIQNARKENLNSNSIFINQVRVVMKTYKEITLTMMSLTKMKIFYSKTHKNKQITDLVLLRRLNL